MLYCSSPVAESWSPNFLPSSQPSPKWTRLRCAGGELANALERVQWQSNPVQVILCDACGSPDCGAAGYVHISRLPDALWWTRLPVNPTDDWEVSHYDVSALMLQHGSVVLPFTAWDELRRRESSLPDAAVYPVTRRADVLSAWLMEIRFFERWRTVDHVLRMLRERLLGCDTLEPDEAIERVEQMILWATVEPETEVVGNVVRANQVGAIVETLYFEGPASEDWPAIARLHDGYSFAFGREWVLDLPLA